MELAAALRLAQASLADAKGIVINRKTKEAHPLPKTSDDIHDRADAYNAIGRHVAALEGCGK